MSASDDGAGIALGAFGVPGGHGGAAWERGQQWLAGTAARFSGGGLDRARLDAWFPSLQECADRRPPDVRGQEGIVHVRLRGGQWYLVHCFQPHYSIARSVPLWLCVSAPAESVASGMLVSSLGRLLLDGRRSVEHSGGSVEAWLRSSTELPANPPPVVADLRRVRSLANLLASRGESPVQLPLDENAWRALQLMIEAAWSMREGATETASGVWCGVRIEPSGSLVGKAQPDLLVHAVRDAATLAADPFECRGVPDAKLLEVIPLRTILAATLSVMKPDSKFDEVLRPPVFCLPADRVEPEEVDEWVVSQWRDRHVGLERLAALAVASSRQNKRSTELLAKMLARSPMCARGEWSEVRSMVESMMESAGVPHRHGRASP